MRLYVYYFHFIFLYCMGFAFVHFPSKISLLMVLWKYWYVPKSKFCWTTRATYPHALIHQGELHSYMHTNRACECCLTIGRARFRSPRLTAIASSTPRFPRRFFLFSLCGKIGKSQCASAERKVQKLVRGHSKFSAYTGCCSKIRNAE